MGCSAISANDQYVALGEIGQGGGLYQRNIYVYCVETGELLHTLGDHRWQIRQLGFSPSGDRLASLGDELIVWDLREREIVLRTRLNRSTGRFAFAGDVLVACDEGRVEVFAGGQRVSSFAAPIGYGVPWTISHDGRFISIARPHGLLRHQLMTGALDRQIDPPFSTPEPWPSLELAQRQQIRGGAMLWRTEWGCFLHQSDGPRGWVEPLELSADGLVAVPCEGGAAVLEVGDRSTAVRGMVPFAGRLRAGRIVDGEVLLLNHEGRLFRARPRVGD